MSEKILDHLKDITACSICKDTLKNQRALPCIHTFCCDCLRQYVSEMKKRVGDKVPCPLCRAEFLLPPGSVTDLPKNFFIEGLLDLLRTEGNIHAQTVCDVCAANEEADNQIALATMNCLECRENMCAGCCKEHKRQRFSRNHQVRSLGTPMSEEKYRSVIHYCDQHSDKQLEIYCTECKMVVCVMCFVESHRQHECTDVKKVAEKFKPDIEKLQMAVETFETEAFEIRKELEKNKHNFLKSVNDTERQIIAAGNKLKSVVDERINSLRQELDSVKQSLLKEFATQQEQLDIHFAALQSLKNYSSALVARGSPYDICRNADSLTTRTSALEESHNSLLNLVLLTAEVNFLSEIDPQGDDFIGKIKIQKKGEKSGTTGKETSHQIEKKEQETEQSITLFIRSHSGTQLVVVDKSSSIGHLHDYVSSLLGVERKMIRLIYQGVFLAEEGDNQTRFMMHDYGIRDGSFIDMILRLAGD